MVRQKLFSPLITNTHSHLEGSLTAGKEYAVKELEMNYAEVKEGETTIAEFTDGW